MFVLQLDKVKHHQSHYWMLEKHSAYQAKISSTYCQTILSLSNWTLYEFATLSSLITPGNHWGSAVLKLRISTFSKYELWSMHHADILLLLLLFYVFFYIWENKCDRGRHFNINLAGKHQSWHLVPAYNGIKAQQFCLNHTICVFLHSQYEGLDCPFC